jgi:hypothetical protein
MPKTEISGRKPAALAAHMHPAGLGTCTAGASTGVGGSSRFRRLKWNELVSQGDYVANGRHGFTLWEGPGGFRAHSFVKPIYRRDEVGPTGSKDAS